MVDDQTPREHGDLDLMGSACEELSVTGVLLSAVRNDMESRILDLMQASPHKVRLEDQKGLGVEYAALQDREDGTFVALQGRLTHFEDENGVWHFGIRVEVTALDEKPSPPPERLGPFDRLLEIGALLGEIQVNCEVHFAYDLDESLRSRILLPSPLLFSAGQSPYDITHIESLVLSRRIPEGISHTVEVLHDPDDSSIAHVVTFSFGGGLTLQSLRAIRVIAERLSRTLLQSGGSPSEEGNR